MLRKAVLISLSLLLSVAVALCCLFILKYFRYWEKRGIPVEQNFFFVNDLLQVFHGRLYFGQWLLKLYQKHNEPYVGFYVMGRPHLLVKDPDIIKSIAIKYFKSFENRSFYCDEKVDPVVGKSLFVAGNPQWKESRTRMNLLFSPSKLKSVVSIITDTSKKIQSYLENHNHEVIDFKEVAESLIANVMPLSFLDIENQCNYNQKDNAIKNAIHNMFRKDWYQAFAFISYCFVPKMVSWFNVRLGNYEFLKNMILDVAKLKEGNCVKGNGISDLLLANINNKGNTGTNQAFFDSNWLVAQGLTLIIAGFLPTSSLFALTLYELSLHQDYQEMLRQEILDYFPAENDPITYEKVTNMKYLHMVMCETLRIDPLGGFMNRVCTQDCCLEEIGLKIEKGTTIFASHDAIHIDPKYFPDPLKFNPERFRDGTKPFESAGIFTPFGVGHRRCIGERFAVTTAKIALVHVIQKFKIEQCELTEKPLMDPTSLGPCVMNGVKLRVHKL